MKQRIYANRGRPFEEFIRFANRRYEMKHQALITKMPTEFIPLRNGYGKVTGAKVEHKSTVDFIGRYKQYPIAIEAKNTNEDSIRFDRVEPHQAAYMDKFTEEPGTIGIVLVSFKLERFFAVPWAFWGEAYDLRVRRGDRKTSVRIKAFDEEWTIPPKFSARIEDMNPSWEVSGRDPDYGLHYLKNAENYLIFYGKNTENKV